MTFTKLVGLAFLLSGCSSEGEPRAELSAVKSEHGRFVGSFEPEPDPPVLGRNALGIRLKDASGTVLTGAEIEVEPWMPSHGHGASVTPVVKELGSGAYHATELDFAMPGHWEIQIDVAARSVQDSFTLGYEVK